ncbi:hypothetical protein ACQR1W_36495 [Bradyrhizobium sp. HKCCYLS1011]|uniref:hypothetical protein n=1 Tax=Bradyrhizobium sp. HKCCYLS1011 TaxID=3420733 RepID=UPI003EBC9A59
MDTTIWRELAPGALAIVLVGYAEALFAAKARPCRMETTLIRREAAPHRHAALEDFRLFALAKAM